MASFGPLERGPVEYEIVAGRYRSTIGRRGATLLSLEYGSSPLIDPVGADELSPGAHGQIMAPWPNRLRDGIWTWEGTRHVLPVDEPIRGHSASHGLARWHYWEMVRHLADQVILRFELAPRPGYPFPITFECIYRLSEHGLEVTISACNVGDYPAPVALGAHPYLMPDCPLEAATLTMPSSQTLSFKEDGSMRPLEPVTANIDLRHGKSLNGLVLNHTFGGLDRVDGHVFCELRGSGGTTLLWAGSSCTWIQVYTGDGLPAERARRSIAIEPMTACPQALATGNASILQPDESLTLTWGIGYSRNESVESDDPPSSHL